VLAERVIERHCRQCRGRARVVTIDLDQTGDPAHGQRQLLRDYLVKVGARVGSASW
jgi:hypothetical protein